MVDISKLKKNSVYEVKVKCSENNLEHNAIFFMGFKTGAYCMVYTNSYDAPIPIKEIYSMTIIKLLTTIKN